MTITLVFLACLMAAILWWLFRQSVNVQPWVAQASSRDVHGAVLSRPPAKTALWVFLAVVTSVFALFISAYAMRMHFGDWTPLRKPTLLTWNTGLLIVTSGVMQWTVVAARRADVEGVRRALVAGGVLTVAFLAGQLLVWKQLNDAGAFLNSNPANAFFYLLTAVHGVHLLGGLVAWARTTAKVSRGVELATVRLGIELCAIYGHFLLLVWLVLFALLMST
ncbi:MAG: cytochrome c oxidase subunit 3 [Rhodospirillaceae bacterium]